MVHDFEPHMETFTEKFAYGLDADASFAEVNPAEFDGLIIPGGRAPEHIRMHEKVPEIVPFLHGKQACGCDLPRRFGI